MKKLTAFRVGRSVGKIEAQLYRTPFLAKPIYIVLSAIMSDLDGDHSDMIEMADTLRGHLNVDDPSQSDKEELRKGYYSLLAMIESELKE